MKLHNKILTAIAIASIVFTSCDKQFDEINTDPNRPTEVPTFGILTTGLRNTASLFNDEWSGQRLTGLPSQQWSQHPYTDEDRYNYGARTGSISGYFEDIYAQVKLFNNIIALNEGTPNLVLATPYGDAILQISSAKIIRAYLMEMCVETFGDVPYTESNKINSGILKPKYDTQKDIFEGLIAELKEVNSALVTIEATGKGWTKGDILFAGNISKWRKFGNSIRLRLAMRMSNINPTLSATEAASAIADGVMESNADNAAIVYTGGGDPSDAPLYESYSSRNDFTPSWQFTNLMKGNNDSAIGFTNPFANILDPRLKVYAFSVDDVRADKVSTRNEGMPYGLPEDNVGKVQSILNAEKKLIKYGKTFGTPAGTLPLIQQATFRVTFMDYTNTALFIAEHKGGDATYFEKGLTASLSSWEVAEQEKAPYIAAVMNKFNAADAKGRLEMIITQKYIHNFAQTMAEPWTEYRRTGFPKSLVLPGQQTGPALTYTYKDTDNTIKTEVIKSYFEVSAAHGNKVIARMKYPLTESSTNRENLAMALQSMGGDAQNIPLWWAKDFKK